MAASVERPQVVNDSKTPSGTVHVGSLRGVVLHDAIRACPARPRHAGRVPLRRRGPRPHGRQALLTPDAVERYMGVPLAHVPAPDGQHAPNYARHFVGTLFLGTFDGSASTPSSTG